MELRDNFQVESFYQFMEEINQGAFPIPVECDEDRDKCAICEEEQAIVEIAYERKGKKFVERTCMRCYAHPDYQEMKLGFSNIKVTLI